MSADGKSTKSPLASTVNAGKTVPIVLDVVSPETLLTQNQKTGMVILHCKRNSKVSADRATVKAQLLPNKT